MEHVSRDFNQRFAALITPQHENGLQEQPRTRILGGGGFLGFFGFHLNIRWFEREAKGRSSSSRLRM